GHGTLVCISCLVDLLSVALHGASLMLVRRDGATVAAPETAATGAADSVPTELSSSSISRENENRQSEVITIPEMREIQRSGAPKLVLDVRSDRSFADSDLRA